VFLAHHLEYKIAGPDLAWWELRLAVPGVRFGIAMAAGVMAGAVTAVAAVLDGLGGTDPLNWAIFAAVVGAIAGGVAARLRSSIPARGIRWKRPSLRVFIVGAVAGVGIGILARAVGGGLARSCELGVYMGVIVGLFAWLVTQEGAPLDVSSTASPSAALRQDRRVAVAGVASGVVLCAAVALLTAGIGLGKGRSVTHYAEGGALLGALAGAVAGVAVALRTAWPSYGLARAWLALRHKLPWRLTGFLADAHNRGVLRQAGAVYEFRHIELQHRLATRPSDRCIKAIQQLGSDKPNARTEAIHALESIAGDSATDYPIVIDALATFIREHSREPQRGAGRRPESRTRPDIQVATTVFKRLNNRRDRHPVNLSGADLSGADLSGTDLSGTDLSGTDLSGTDLSGAKLNGADLSGANLTGAALSIADLSSLDLSGLDLSAADLSAAKLNGADLTGANLSGAKLNGANLNGANLNSANLNAANLSGADLRGTNLSAANLDGVLWYVARPVPDGWFRDSTARLSRSVPADADDAG
jgi:uncharacterized protein YjbI with pentapeptide repeats